MKDASPSVQKPSSPSRQALDLTEGSIPRALLRIALPTWGAFITHDLMGIVDMFFVGRLGPGAIAAVAMSSVMSVSYTHLRAHET